MHSHGHDHLETSETQRSAPARHADAADPVLWQAAARGRTDVLGAQGMLRLQRAAGNAAVSELAEEERSPVLDVIGSGGQSLDPAVRGDMEARLGHDFSDVRVHTDEAAHASARAVDAHAYTVGSDIVFQRGNYDTVSDSGRTMLAHELTHVVQQRSGPVDGTPTGDGVRVSDPSDRFEREAAATAERVVSAPAPAVQTAAAASAGEAGAVQREAEDEEELQGAFVQREEAGEEELEESA
ncbi:eCIS core domain-containing protein [Georgenia wangjunii]|uniref:eCIS core domain-containing protein n=1 Tax=Georgenia wangjunii TaxID=3117730 RepID=UPI002F26096F